MNIIKTKNFNEKVWTNRTNKTFTTPQKWDMIVNHITEGYMPGTLDWLTNPKATVSTHFLVTRDGKVYQQNDLKHGAWHALKREPKNGIVKSRQQPPNLYTVAIEHEGVHSQTQGRLTPDQYNATLELHKYLIQEYEKVNNEPFPIDRDHIVGHYEIDSVNRSITDPGAEFPWTRLLADLKLWDAQRKAPIPDKLNGPYITPEGERLWFRAIAGSYQTREEAQAEVDRLEKEGKSAWLQAVYVPIIK